MRRNISKEKIDLTKKIKFEIKLIFSKTHTARTTVEAESKEEAYFLARKKYSSKTILDLIFLNNPTAVALK